MKHDISERIIQNLVDKHNLTRGQIIVEIEKTFSAMLSTWHRKNVVVIFSERQLTAQAYVKNADGLKQIPVELSVIRGWNTIKRIIIQNCEKASCLQKIKKYKEKEHQLVWGEILKKNNNGHLAVEIDFEGSPVIATCLINHIGVHERNVVRAGDVKAFHVRRVEAVFFKRVPRFKVMVDRVSKTLVEILLKEKLGDIGGLINLKCKKRYVGHKSFVVSNHYLPGKIIKEVKNELKEHIQVTVQEKKNRK